MMHFIFGGIHPEGRKDATRRKPLANMEVEPTQVAIPLSMHSGEPCQPTVAVGDTVAVGQPIACNEQGVLVHASVSGKVVAVEPRTYPWGGESPAVVICNDGCNTPWTEQEPGVEDYKTLSGEEITRRIRQAGIIGMGGAGYPTADKVENHRDRVDTVIVNAAESEPYVTADHRLLLECSEGVLVGLALLKKAVGASNGVIAVEGNKLNAAEVLERTAARCKLGGKVCTIPSRYPLGAEKQVIRAVTGREVPPGQSAGDVGCVVFNAATAYAVYEAVVKGMPLIRRVVTVTGAAVARPRNLWVPIGTSMEDLLRAAGGLKEEPTRVLVGGPMMGVDQYNLLAPVMKNTNCLICMLDWEVGEQKQETVCIRCGRCVSVCPMNLMPLLVDKELKLGGDVEELRRLHTEDCIGCGCCTYICPSHIPLVERMGQARERVEQAADEEVTP